MAAELIMLKMFPGSASTQYLTVISGAVLGSLLPDIDSGNSKISNTNTNTQVTGLALESLLRHRGMVHTPFTAALITVILYYLAPLALRSAFSVSAEAFGLFSLSVGVGFLSHLILDSANPQGIMWLWPIKKRRYKFGKIQPNSLGDWLVFGGLVVFATYLATYVLHIPIQDIMNNYLPYNWG